MVAIEDGEAVVVAEAHRFTKAITAPILKRRCSRVGAAPPMIKRRAALSWANSEAAQTQLERGGLDPFDPFPWRQGERKTPTVEHGPRLFAKRGWASPCVLAAVARRLVLRAGLGWGPP